MKSSPTCFPSFFFIPSHFHRRSKNNKISITFSENFSSFLFSFLPSTWKDVALCMKNKIVTYWRSVYRDIIFNMIFVMWSRKKNGRESTNQTSCNATMIYFGQTERKRRISGDWIHKSFVRVCLLAGGKKNRKTSSSANMKSNFVHNRIHMISINS